MTIPRRTILISGVTLATTALISSEGSSASPASIAKTSAGTISGTYADGIHSFKAVPYGEAGTTLRFRPPEPPAPWTGIRDATQYMARFPDLGESESAYAGGSPLRLSAPLPYSEDCLHLNLWTPGLRDGDRRPVMVWLHGGGFHGGAGSNPSTDGTRLARRGDVVIVNVTHRLNAFGFLHLADLPGGGEYPDSGNVGMLDIIHALKWIRENISEFGGDPKNVTVFGFSGGAGKVATLMAMPAAKGLFHRAICMSGSTGIGGRSARYASLDAEMLMHLLGLKANQVHDLAHLPMEQLRSGAIALKKHRVLASFPWGSFSSRDWRPVVDGRTLTTPPWYPNAPDASRDVPVLIGTTHDEVRMHLLGSDPSSVDIPWSELEPRIKDGFEMEAGRLVQPPWTLTVDDAIDWYRTRFPELTASALQFKIMTFLIWRHSAIWQAEKRVEGSARAKTWMYRVDWGTPVDGGKWGACHGIDRPFVFDNVEIDRSVFGDQAAQAQHLADQMSEAWIAFARNGNPNCPAVPAWPEYGLSDRATMIFDQTSHVESDPERDERQLFSGLPPKLSK